MQSRFRADYLGEFVVTNTIWAQGRRTQQREWIANPIENQHISGRAAVIGSRDSRQDAFPRGIDYRILQKHRGGLLGTLKLQTYGTGTIAEDMRLDFAVELDPAQLVKLVESKYYENNVVYTTAKNCINNPGDFYLIPLHPKLALPALPIYLAAFDGHNEIFLIGYSKQMPADHPVWIQHVAEIIEAYPGVKFWCIGEDSNMPDEWFVYGNCKTMPYRDFIGYADI